MKTALICAFAFVSSALVLTGCSVGNQPESPSVDDIKKTIAAKPIDEQIALIEHSPMPAAQKAQKIAELKAKAGKK